MQTNTSSTKGYTMPRYSAKMHAGTVSMTNQRDIVYAGRTVFTGDLQECMAEMAKLDQEDRMWHKIL